FIAQVSLPAVRLDNGDWHRCVRSDPYAVHPVTVRAKTLHLSRELATVVFPVGDEEKQLAGPAVVLARHFARILQCRADIGAEQRLWIVADPVEIERNGFDVVRQVRENQRSARKADEPDAADPLRLVLDEILNLLR